MRFGPGPVFVIELIAAARRWQHFAVRAGLVFVLLLALTLVWANDFRGRFGTGRTVSHADHAELGENFAIAVLGTQLALILLAAPAATAGAICIDKARGNLLLLMVTDLSAHEIVLGKLAARLWPVLSLVAASVPVLFIGSLMGGIGGDLLLGGFAILVGTAVLGCAVAFLISVYVGKTHEALLLTYLLIGIWLLSYPIYGMAAGWGGGIARSLMLLNPFALLVAPTTPRMGVTDADFAIFLGATFGLATLCTIIAAWRIRPVALHQASQTAKAGRRRRLGRRAQKLLDRSPLRWYERHRRRPSKAGRFVWGIYIAAVVAGVAWVTLDAFKLSRSREIAPMVDVIGVGVGLLLATVAAVTAMSDERARGSLDILLATPIASRDVVRAKWRSAFRIVLWVAVLPTIVGGITLVPWELLQGATVRARGFPLNRNQELTWLERLSLYATLVIHPIACGAVFTSLGLLLATWLKQFVRAVGIAVAAYALLAVGWMFFVVFVTKSQTDIATFFIVASPLFAQFQLTSSLSENWGRNNYAMAAFIGALAWSSLNGVFAYGLYRVTIQRFDRWMGRIPDGHGRHERFALPGRASVVEVESALD